MITRFNILNFVQNDAVRKMLVNLSLIYDQIQAKDINFDSEPSLNDIWY